MAVAGNLPETKQADRIVPCRTTQTLLQNRYAILENQTERNKDMTREEAKIWLSIPREKLAVIAQNIDRHYDVIAAYANGADVQIVDIDTSEWIDRDDPLFAYSRSYRVKPSAEQPAETWKPQDGEKFFCVCGNGEVYRSCFIKTFRPDRERVAFGNCFRTREEAEAARERVHAALNGETVSKAENVESLDGHELSDAEKGVIRILRRCKVETMWNGPFVYLEGQKTLITCNAGVLFKFELGSKASDFGDLADDVIAEAEERREKGEPSW